MSSETLCIRVPATSANLGPGFDTFGLALKCYNRFFLTPAPHGSDQLTFSQNSCVDLAGVCEKPSDSLLFKALDRFYQYLNQARPPIHAEVEAHIPLARGLGSSSSVIVAGLAGANMMEGSPLSIETLLQLATALEGHPDNVAPALLGGAVFCDMSQTEGEGSQTTCRALPWPEAWGILVAVPPYRLLTEKARAVLPRTFSREDALFNMRKASLLTYGLLQQDAEAFSKSLDDRLHQPYRSALIPEFEPIRELCAKAGAFGTVISGAGPSVAVFFPKNVHETVMSALVEFQTQNAPDMRILSLSPDRLGAHAV